MKIIEAPSPNFDARTAPPDMIVLHYTGMQTGEAALARMCDAAVEVSAHYMVEEDGRIFRLVPEERRAWHAGASYWKGRTALNGVSIGVEIVNPGLDWGYRPYPKAQIRSVIELVADIRTRWMVQDRDIVGHSDIAPDRKEDPGELFPWRKLAEAGHGLWTDVRAAPGAPLAEGETGPGVFALQAGLTRLGYDCAPSGEYEPRTTTIVRAFQRHWRPQQVDGIADGETRARLIALLKLAA
jgi:N-acetylmuramoyl-L-alanine amidase